MPETPEEFWERAKGALRTPPVEEWDSWPFDGVITPRILEPRRHVDFPDLDAELASELGPMLLRVYAAVAGVPGVGNVHIGRFGEGSEHCHIWFFGRPARMTQLRSSFAAIWDDVLPPTPEDVWHANLEIVHAELKRG